MVISHTSMHSPNILVAQSNMNIIKANGNMLICRQRRRDWCWYKVVYERWRKSSKQLVMDRHDGTNHRLTWMEDNPP